MKKFVLFVFVLILAFASCKKKNNTSSSQTNNPTPQTPSNVMPYNVGNNGGLSISINNSNDIIVGTPYNGVKVVSNGSVTTYTWSGYTSDVVRYTCIDRQNNLCFKTDVLNNPPFNFYKILGGNLSLISNIGFGYVYGFVGNSIGEYFYYHTMTPSYINATSSSTTTMFSYALTPTVSAFQELAIDNNNVVWYTGITGTSGKLFTGTLAGGIFSNKSFVARNIVFDSSNELWACPETYNTDTLLNYTSSVLTKHTVKDKISESNFNIVSIHPKGNKVFVYGKGSSGSINLVAIFDKTTSTWRKVDLNSIISAAGYNTSVTNIVVDSNENIWCLIGTSTNNLLKITSY